MYQHHRLGFFARTRIAIREIIRMYSTAGMQCPGCGHTVQGDERSWWCTNCGGAGSSS